MCLYKSTNSSGISELIQHNENGLIFNTVDQCVKYLSLSSNYNSSQLNHITDNAQNTISKNFNVKYSTSKYVKIWNEII